jgi:hypothetical protein
MARYDLKKYAGTHFVKPADVRDEPRRDKIVGVRENTQYGKLELILESGDILSLNATNTEILMDAYGRNSDELVHKEIELKFGTTRYQGEDHDTVVVVPITKARGAMDDEIPYDDPVPDLGKKKTA